MIRRFVTFAATAAGLVALGQAHSARRRQRLALVAANQRLADADRRKNEFIAVLSHELRNPLACIRYALPMLASEPLDQRAACLLARVARQVDRLSRLVDDLLDVSRVDRGQFDLQPQFVTLSAVVNAAVDAVPPAVVDRHHHLTTAVPEEAVWLRGDPARLGQILANLLDNAAKYTPAGGEIALEAARDGDSAVIRVRDNGIGIPPASLNTVFEMFRQVDASANAGSGLGIGLALTKALVEMHGGTVEAHSDGPGAGSEFVVRLPVERSPQVVGV